jgi:outer membrane protein OmpA-like peptidoglycan-associated protein
MTFRHYLLAATVVAGATALVPAAQAQPVTGFYIGAGAGGNFLQDETAHVYTNNFGSTYKRTYNFDTGAAGNLSVGYGLGNGLRFEIEGDYTYNSVNSVRGGYTTSSTNGKGTQQEYGGFANALYDLDLGMPVVPYFGAGVGYQWLQHHNFDTAPYGTTGSNDQTKGGLAYQAIVGAAYPLTPNLSLTAEYRFIGVNSVGSYSGTYYSGKTAYTSKVDYDNIYNHQVLLGVRYAFGAATVLPEIAPVVQPGVARSYLVFFDWDKANLTVRARQIISEAAHASTTVQYTRIEVNGYTDTSGTPRYNQGLSIRRAQAVAAELVRDGVPRAAISIQGFGETHLLVPTGPGVREPQNRRVEIIIR